MLRVVIFISVLTLAAFFRLLALGSKSLWIDEVLSWRLLQFPLVEMIARTGGTGTVHPPLYFLVLRVWTAVWGDSEFALRSLSAAFGMFTVAGVYALMFEVLRLPGTEGRATSAGSPRAAAALLATVLVALNPLQIHLSRQARGYSMATALFVWGSWLLLRALRSQRPRGIYWVGFGLCTLLFCYTHYLALFSVVGQGLFVLLYLVVPRGVGTEESNPPVAGRGSAPPWLLKQVGWAGAIALVVAVGFLFWLPSLVNQMMTVSRGSWQAQISVSRVALETYISLFSTPANQLNIIPTEAWLASVFVLVVLLSPQIQGGWGGRFLAVTGLIPVILILIYSCVFSPNLYYSRYLAFAQIAWLMGLGLLVVRIPTSAGRWAWGAAMIAASLYGCHGSWDEIGPHASPGMRAAISYLLTQCASDEPIVTVDKVAFLESSYYLRGKRQPLYMRSDASAMRVLERSAHITVADAILPEALSSRKPNRVWLVCREDETRREWLVTSFPHGMILENSTSFPQDYRWEGPAVDVECYRPGRPIQKEAAPDGGPRRGM
jgi:mannosyltransferase